MFGKSYSDEFIAHLQEEISVLRTQIGSLQILQIEKDRDQLREREAWAKEREQLINRLAGLPPQPATAGENDDETSEPIRYESRSARAMRELKERQEKQYLEYLAATGARDKGIEAFREEAQAQAAEVD